jgi:hypothetical protein
MADGFSFQTWTQDLMSVIDKALAGTLSCSQFQDEFVRIYAYEGPDLGYEEAAAERTTSDFLEQVIDELEFTYDPPGEPDPGWKNWNAFLTWLRVERDRFRLESKV